MKEELLCEWQKFKYNSLQMKEQIPSEVLNPPPKNVSKSPTEWALHKMLSMRATNQHFVPGLLYLAELCLSLPVSNAWPERGASAVKRLKKRMRSRLGNDMLGALLHITLNGPDVMEADQLIKATVKEWMKIKPRRKIAKGKKTTFSDAAVQADLHTTPDPQIISLEGGEMEQSEDEMLLEELEVNPALKEMKLPQPDAVSDSSGDSDYDSDYDEQYDFLEI